MNRGQSWAAVERFVLEDAVALIEGGVDALIIENFGSAPFRKGTRGDRLPPHQVAFLALLLRLLKRSYEVPSGVNCLRNDAISALGIAAAAGADFIRVNVHVGAYVTDQGIVEGEAEQSLRYRRELGAEDVAILADVLVKHAHPMAPLSPAQAVKDTLNRGLADAVIVTGAATGSAVDVNLLEEVRGAALSHPVLIGSGLDPYTAETLAPLAEGAIVGTWLKRRGEVREKVDEVRVRELVSASRRLFRKA